MSVPLYDLTAQYRELQLLAEDGEIDATTLADTLEGIEGAFEEKAKAVAAIIGNMISDADAITDAAKLMRKRAERLEARAEALRAYLLVNMQACKRDKIFSPYFTISLKKNPQHVDITDAASVPDEFKFWPDPPPQQINGRLLLAALKALKEDETIPGAKLGQNKRIEIKP